MQVWRGPALICPACRKPPVAAELGADLACSNSECGQRYPWLAASIPVVASPAARERVASFDVPGVLPGAGELAQWLRQFGPETAGFRCLSRAAIFLRAMREGAEEPFYADLCDALLRDEPEIKQVLDLGCGAGNLTFELARRTPATVTGLDLDAHLLRWAEQARDAAEDGFEIPVRMDAARFAAGSMRVRGGFDPDSVQFIAANLLDPPFGPESFDLVMLVNVLDAVPYPRVALRQAVALLKPGGHILFASPDSWNEVSTPIARWLATTADGWDRVFGREGLETVKAIDNLEWRLQDSPRLHHLYGVHGRLLRKPKRGAR